MKIIQNHKGLTVIALSGLFFILLISSSFYSDLLRHEKGVFVENFILLEETDINKIFNINEVTNQDSLLIPQELDFHNGDILLRFSLENFHLHPEE